MTQRNLPKIVSEKAVLEGVPKIQGANAGDSKRPHAYANSHGAQLLWKMRRPALRWPKKLVQQSKKNLR